MSNRKLDLIVVGATVVMLVAIGVFLFQLARLFLNCAPGDVPWEDYYPWFVAEAVYAVADIFETFIVKYVC